VGFPGKLRLSTPPSCRCAPALQLELDDLTLENSQLAVDRPLVAAAEFDLEPLLAILPKTGRCAEVPGAINELARAPYVVKEWRQ